MSRVSVFGAKHFILRKTATLQHDSSIRTNIVTVYCVALFTGFLRIELTEKLYSKVAIFGTTNVDVSMSCAHWNWSIILVTRNRVFHLDD